MLEHFLDPSALTDACPLYVSLYPHVSNASAVLDLVRGEMLARFDTKESEFKLLQSLSMDERHEALIASAAIPVAFQPRRVEGKLYSDGGQGGYRSAQGNTPITPLLGQGLDLIIVSHLSDGVLWDCDDFPDENILELRPKDRISTSALDMLGFSDSKIREWMTQGREVTARSLAALQRIGGARLELSAAENGVKSLLEEGLKSSDLEDVMSRLKKI